MMGENGTGKTTFCRLLAGAIAPDGNKKVPEMKISMKPQTITPKFEGTVRQLFFKKIRAQCTFRTPRWFLFFFSPCIKPADLPNSLVPTVPDRRRQALEAGRLH